MVIYVYNDLDIAEGQLYSFTSGGVGFILSETNPQPPPAPPELTNRGNIVLSWAGDTNYGMSAIQSSFGPGSDARIWNTKTGVISVTTSSAVWATAYTQADWLGGDGHPRSGGFFNDGAVRVTTKGEARGVEASHDDTNFTFNNTGYMGITGSGAIAAAMDGQFTNYGVIDVRASSGGVSNQRPPPSSPNAAALDASSANFTNFGVIHVDNSDPWANNIGVAIDYGTITNSGTLRVSDTASGAVNIAFFAGQATIINSGVVTADYVIKIKENIQGGTHNTLAQTVLNTGSMNGIVDLMGGDDRVVNSGHINGQVYLGDGANVYDGHNGYALAVHGGEGNDLIIGSGYRDDLSGGGGVDTVSFAYVQSGMTISLAQTGWQNETSGPVRISGFENIIGTAFNDVLTGDSGDNVITGGGGSDVIDGGAGVDTAVFGARTGYAVHSAKIGGVFVTTVSGDGSSDTLTNVEQYIFGGAAFTFTGIQQNHEQNLAGGRYGYYDDVVFQNSATGAVQTWSISAAPNDIQTLLAALPSSLKVVGTGDIDGDARADLLVQDSATGALYAYENHGSGWTQSTLINGGSPSLRVISAGDINGDGLLDILVRDTSTGADFYRDLHLGTWNAVANPGLGCSTVGLGDINRDGYADIVIQNDSTGATYYANMAGGVFSGWGTVAGAVGPPSTAWKAVGVGDINGDGYFDVVYQNQATGQVWYANMLGGSNHGWGVVSTVPGWSVKDVADVNNDGYADVIIQNNSDGRTYFANMQGGTFHGWGSVTGALGTDWHVV